MHPTRKPIPLTIVSGFLGAGKTTLLNHILNSDHGLRIAVVVNDFGRINVDAKLIAAQDAETISLANGCICCSMGDSLMITLLALLQRSVPPEHLIIEASGVSDPWKIAQIGVSNDAFALDAIIALADVELVRDQASDKYVGETVLRQLAAADIIVLNKLDLVSEEQAEASRNWIEGFVPQARVIETTQARAPLAVLLRAGASRAAAQVTQESRDDRGSHEGEHSHDEEYWTWAFTADVPFRGKALREAISALPLPVIRAKGVLFVDEDPLRQFLFQLVGKRWDLTPGPRWGEAPPRSQLVIIGRLQEVDASALLASFHSALVASSGTTFSKSAQ